MVASVVSCQFPFGTVQIGDDKIDLHRVVLRGDRNGNVW
jgi:hypothetical protein